MSYPVYNLETLTIYLTANIDKIFRKTTFLVLLFNFSFIKQDLFSFLEIKIYLNY